MGEKHGGEFMQQSTKKICVRCNKNEVTNGTSLCDKCYEEHNEIFGITNEFNSKKKKETKSVEYFVLILIVIMTIIISAVINSRQQTSEINIEMEQVLDYGSFPKNEEIIYGFSQYQNIINNYNHGIITVQSPKENAYLIKVIDSVTKETIYEIFMQPENKVTIPLMLGEYELYLASGKKWFNEIDHFGVNTIYSRLDKKFIIDMNGDQISGWTIQLQVRKDGNLKSEKMNKEDW